MVWTKVNPWLNLLPIRVDFCLHIKSTELENQKPICSKRVPGYLALIDDIVILTTETAGTAGV